MVQSCQRLQMLTKHTNTKINKPFSLNTQNNILCCTKRIILGTSWFLQLYKQLKLDHLLSWIGKALTLTASTDCEKETVVINLLLRLYTVVINMENWWHTVNMAVTQPAQRHSRWHRVVVYCVLDIHCVPLPRVRGHEKLGQANQESIRGRLPR